MLIIRGRNTFGKRFSMRRDVPPCQILENAWIARIAAWKLHSDQMAVTLGNRIYLWHTDRETFLGQPAWVRHELCHVRQFQRYGWVRFLGLYLWENLRHGYRGNAFEQEARAAETEDTNPGTEMFATC